MFLGLNDSNAVREACRTLRAKLGDRLAGILVQEMVDGGVETIVGVSRDRTFGPLVLYGSGGTLVELLGDVAVRLTPLSDLDAREMLRSMRLFPLLDGYRGAPPCDIPALEELLLRVSALVEAHPEVVEMDLNPVIALPSGALIVDARIRIEQAAPNGFRLQPCPSVAPWAPETRCSPGSSTAFSGDGRWRRPCASGSRPAPPPS